MTTYVATPDSPTGLFDAGAIYSTVYVARHSHGLYIVTAHDMYGRVFRQRQYAHGTNRRDWALEQARQWADRFGLWLDERIHD